ncbi:hypothetical protein [Xanthomonas arboricola]|uniref:hypothetical protein n=1 Tax=Xanthomonas arboricola TaxID=56448 RepID=UPI00128FFC5D|nr:hypothetical protein [Xanthomonas arboricola]
MGLIDLESWNAKIANIDGLNNEPEILRMGLIFHRQANYIYASVQGNVSTYYVVIQELLKYLGDGSFQGKVVTSGGVSKNLVISRDYVLEDMRDISTLVGL